MEYTRLRQRPSQQVVSILQSTVAAITTQRNFLVASRPSTSGLTMVYTYSLPTLKLLYWICY